MFNKKTNGDKKDTPNSTGSRTVTTTSIYTASTYSQTRATITRTTHGTSSTSQVTQQTSRAELPYRTTWNSPLSMGNTSKTSKPPVATDAKVFQKSYPSTPVPVLNLPLSMHGTQYQSPFANSSRWNQNVITSGNTSAQYQPSVFGSYSRATGSNIKPFGIGSSNLQLNNTNINKHARSNSLGKIRKPEDFLSKELKVKVKKAKTKPYDIKQSKVPVYPTDSKRRGKVFIVNNVKFVSENDRKGAEIDDRNIRELFKQMGFNETHHKNLSAYEMKRKLEKFCKDDELKKVDIGVIVMMSHGWGDIQSNNSEIIGVDGGTVHTHWITDQFVSDNCPNLAGKPKIFIFQSCRGEKKIMQFKTDTDGKPINRPIRNVQDMLIANSTLPGYVSHRDLCLGTWYIQAICKIFMEHAHDTHVEDLFKLVDLELSNFVAESGSRQTASYENRGFKICYLNPK